MKFTCAECKQEFPHGNLSSSSLAISGTGSKINALEVLEPYDHVCTRCDDLISASVSEVTDFRDGLSNLQQWYTSGLVLTEVQRDWLNLNY